ncbi:MAG: polyphosphate kinase [Bacteroidia bacterium]|jgi:PPK2 family polyphosphate:nucleotide phosphotransferase|nr:polyphosphate kinase [Bacteroidia bacterium]
MKKPPAEYRAPKSLNKDKAKQQTEKWVEEIGQLQKIFHAQGKFSLLIVLQGLDASGKDGLIGKVFDAINPLGCTVKAFKAPTPEERAHDFLWRVHEATPAAGMIQIFNRSHYEDVLVPWVEGWIDEKTLLKRYKAINNFEELLTDNQTVVLKFMLNVSREEQQERLMERRTDPTKFWKHSDGDWETAKKYDAYMQAYARLLDACNQVPWTVVPADQNWYKEYVVAGKIAETLRKLPLEWPALESNMPAVKPAKTSEKGRAKKSK